MNHLNSLKDLQTLIYPVLPSMPTTNQTKFAGKAVFLARHVLMTPVANEQNGWMAHAPPPVKRLTAGRQPAMFIATGPAQSALRAHQITGQTLMAVRALDVRFMRRARTVPQTLGTGKAILCGRKTIDAHHAGTNSTNPVFHLSPPG